MTVGLIDSLRSETEQTTGGHCDCDARVAGERLVVDATACEGGGDLAARGACRRSAIDALAAREAGRVLVRSHGFERAYEGASAALLVAAGRFAAATDHRHRRLADLARCHPLEAARAAVARAPPIPDLAAETGLLVAAEGVGYEPGVAAPPDLESVLEPFVGPSIARSKVRRRPPAGARLRETRELETGAMVRTYDTDTGPVYHLDPVECRLDPPAVRALVDVREELVDRTTADPDGTVGRVTGSDVLEVAGDVERAATVADVLEKHTSGYGVLSDLFSDPRVSDVFATAPVETTPLRVVVGGERMPTNVRLTAGGAETLASRLRRESGRSFSRAAPTLDATAETDSGRIRVAGVAEPASDGVAFAFRDHGGAAYTLPGLVENGTLSANAAAVLSVAVERDAAALVAGARGAGKTTLLGAVLWELPPATRTVVIEDTPELPLEELRDAGRDVQSIRTSTDDGPSIRPTEALRTALRLGEGALVVGEVRGEEAAVLYEAMRVGASASATLGTIHGDGAEAVRERVVSDLGVPVSSFAATDLVVTVARRRVPGGIVRRVEAIEEVVRDGDGVRFAELFSSSDPSDDGRRECSFGTRPPEGTGRKATATGANVTTTSAGSPGGRRVDASTEDDPACTTATATGRIERGDSRVVADLAEPGESYADVLEAIADRREALLGLVAAGRTDPRTVADAYATDRR